MKKNNENNLVNVEMLFQLYVARVAAVDTRSTMRMDVSPLFNAALKEAKTALEVFDNGIAR